MERLTEVENGTAMVKGCGSNCKYGFEYCRKEDWENCKTIDDVIDKLAEYEDLEEQGLLLRLPVKVGDIVYIISRNNEIIPLNVYGIDIRKDDFTISAKNEKYYGYSVLSLLGKYESVDWFITRAEAEQKLKELRGEQNGKID